MFIIYPAKMPRMHTRNNRMRLSQTHSGYTSRLFFKERIQTTKQVNWNGQFLILGVQWYAFSYNNIKDMPLMNMIMSHLRGMVA